MPEPVRKKRKICASNNERCQAVDLCMIERLPLELQFGILDQVVWSWWELIEMRFVSKCMHSVATSYMSNFTSFEVTVNEPFTSSLLEICFRKQILPEDQACQSACALHAKINAFNEEPS